MSNEKRRHRRRRRKNGGIKGHCHMCSLATTDGRRNGRTLTVQEQAARVSEREQTDMTNDEELDAIFGPPMYCYIRALCHPTPSSRITVKKCRSASRIDSLPVVDFDGSDEALERGQIKKPPPSVS